MCKYTHLIYIYTYRRFRIIPAELYILHFASDRSHMIISSDNSEDREGIDAYSVFKVANDNKNDDQVCSEIMWSSEPPPWSLIQGSTTVPVTASGSSNGSSGSTLKPMHNISTYWDMPLSVDKSTAGTGASVDIQMLGGDQLHGVVVELSTFYSIVSKIKV